MKTAKREFWIGVVFLVLSIAYFLGSFTISSYSGYGNQVVDSKFMPRVLGALMAILSVIQILSGLKKMREQKNAPAEETHVGTMTASSVEEAKENFDEDAYVKGSNLRDIVVIAGLLLFYVATFKALGFILSSMIFLFCTILFLTPKEKRNWFWIIGLSVVLPVAIYFLFVSGFKLKLPAGILNF